MSESLAELQSAVVVVWIDYGCEGWKPKTFASDSDALGMVLSGETYGSRFVVMRPVALRLDETK